MPTNRKSNVLKPSWRHLVSSVSVAAALAIGAPVEAVLIDVNGDGDQSLSFPFGVAAGGQSPGTLSLRDFTTTNVPFVPGVPWTLSVADLHMEQPDLGVGSETVSVAFDFTVLVAGVAQTISFNNVVIQYTEDPVHETVVSPVISSTLFFDLGAVGTMRLDIDNPSVTCTALLSCTSSLTGTYTLVPEPGTLALLALGVVGVVFGVRARRQPGPRSDRQLVGQGEVQAA